MIVRNGFQALFSLDRFCPFRSDRLGLRVSPCHADQIRDATCKRARPGSLPRLRSGVALRA